MSRVGISVVGLFATLSFGAHAADQPVPVGAQPYELVRSLRNIQDKVARGSEQAHAFQRQFVERIGQSILTSDAEVWKDRRNVRAAIIFALSGGDPRVLRDAMTKFVLSEADDRIWRGAIAYAEGRTGEAAELLLPLNPRDLDISLAGHVALVQAIMTVRRNPDRAIRLLDDARLLAPGTLIEEAAIRRQTTLVAAAGDHDAFERLSITYLRRFGRSIYLSGFLQSFVRVLITTPIYSQDTERIERLKARIDALDPVVARDTYLAIAEEAIVRGKVELTRLAAKRAIDLVKDGTVARLRLRVYEGAALVVTDQYEEGLKILQGIDRSRLDAVDASLLDSALALAAAVRRPVDAEEPVPTPPSQVGLRAQQAISRVDEFLPR